MRGGDDRSGELFSYVDLEARVRRDHPLRAIRSVVNEALAALERDFSVLYAPVGRPSCPTQSNIGVIMFPSRPKPRTEKVGQYELIFDSATYVRVVRFGVRMFAGTPEAARAYARQWSR